MLGSVRVSTDGKKYKKYLNLGHVLSLSKDESQVSRIRFKHILLRYTVDH